MIQDIAPHRMHNEFIPGKEISDDAVVFCFNGHEASVFENGEDLILPRKKDIPEGTDLRYLFRIDDQDFFLAKDLDTPLHGSVPMDIQRLRRNKRLEKHLIFAALTAWQLSDWYDANRYCGSCAAPTVDAKDERAIDCPSCGRRIYPRIQPAVIVAVTDGDRLLTTKYAGRGIHYDALIAGFVEIGETVEECVKREVMEEVGLKVKNLRYYKSQPWAVADDILMGFFCDVDGSTDIRMDTHELKEAVWRERDEIVGQPDDFSLTNEMMMLFKAGGEPMPLS